MAACSELIVKLDDDSKSCGTCKKKRGVTTAGVKFCVDCARWLCRTCLDAHDLFFESHKLTDKPNADSFTPKPCPDHTDINVMFFCNNCRRCVCPMCLVDDGEHKTHDCVSISKRIEAVRKDVQAAIDKLKTSEKNAEDKLSSLNQQFSEAADRLQELEEKIQTEMRNLADEHQRMKNEVEKELIEKKDSIAKEINELQKCLTEADLAVDVMDTSLLIDDANLQLPEIGQFREGLHDAGLQMMVGGDLSDKQKVEVLKTMKPLATTPPGLHEAGLGVVFGDDLSDVQKANLLKSVKPPASTVKEIHEVGQKLLLGEQVSRKHKADVLEVFKTNNIFPQEVYEMAVKIVTSDDQSIDRSSKISLLSSTKLDHQQVTKTLNYWNIRPSQLTVQQQAGLIRTGSRVRRGRDWPRGMTADGNGLGTAVAPVSSNGLVNVRWDCSGKSYQYFTGYNNNYQLTLVD